MTPSSATRADRVPPLRSAARRAEVLQTACLTLTRCPADEVTATVVTLPAAPELSATLEIMDLARRIAAAHDLEAEIHLHGSWISVRYSRSRSRQNLKDRQ